MPLFHSIPTNEGHGKLLALTTIRSLALFTGQYILFGTPSVVSNLGGVGLWRMSKIWTTVDDVVFLKVDIFIVMVRSYNLSRPIDAPQNINLFRGSQLGIKWYVAFMMLHTDFEDLSIFVASALSTQMVTVGDNNSPAYTTIYR